MTVMQGIRQDFAGFSFLQGLMLLLIGAASMQLTLWATDREPPATTISSRAEGPATPGGVLTIRYNVERYRSCPYKVDRIVQTARDAMIPLKDDDWAAAPGPMGRQSYLTYVEIPAMMDPGPAIYRVILTYRCNLLQYAYPIVVRTETPFVVAGR